MSGGAGVGSVYRLVPKAVNSHTFTVLHTFGGDDGRYPLGNLVRDSAGNLYGTTEFGGAYSAGTVVEIAADGTFNTLHAFTSETDGSDLQSGLAIDGSGNLYGTASGGGPHGVGTVFRIDPERQFSVVHAFTGGTDGAVPVAQLTLGPDGNLYGAANNGGPAFNGTIFRLSPLGRLRVLDDFENMTDDGGYPLAGVSFYGNGNLYGTAHSGGQFGAGTAFKLRH